MQKSDYLSIVEKLSIKPSTDMAIVAMSVNSMLLIIGGFCCCSDLLVLNLLAPFFLGLFLHHCYIIVHECTHATLVSNKFANVLIGHVYGVFSLVPFYCRKFEHLQHHTWAGNLIHEPATRRAMEKFLKEDSWMDSVLKVCWRSWIPILSFSEQVCLWQLPFSGASKLAERNSGRCCFSVVITGGILIVLSLGAVVFFETMHWITILLSYYFYFVLIEVYNLPHHLDAEVYEADCSMPLWRHNLLTRSGANHGFFSKLLFLNFNRHVEHHFFPNIPWHEIPRISEKLNQKLDEPIICHEEWSWNWKARTSGFSVVFSKYLKFTNRKEGSD